MRYSLRVPITPEEAAAATRALTWARDHLDGFDDEALYGMGNGGDFVPEPAHLDALMAEVRTPDLHLDDTTHALFVGALVAALEAGAIPAPTGLALQPAPGVALLARIHQVFGGEDA